MDAEIRVRDNASFRAVEADPEHRLRDGLLAVAAEETGVDEITVREILYRALYGSLD